MDDPQRDDPPRDNPQRDNPDRSPSRKGGPRLNNDRDTGPKVVERTRAKPATRTERPRLYKVILVNDDFTPREFVILVLKAVFRMNEEEAHRVMMTAHQKGSCVVAVFTREVAETKAKEATDLGRRAGHPLFFSTEPEK